MNYILGLKLHGIQVSRSYKVRVPVMGPYIHASVFNEDSVARGVEVMAYLST